MTESKAWQFAIDNFIDDEEKMRDFAEMSKEDFLSFYSYLTEEEYDNTKLCVMLTQRQKYYMKLFGDPFEKLIHDFVDTIMKKFETKYGPTTYTIAYYDLRDVCLKVNSNAEYHLKMWEINSGEWGFIRYTMFKKIIDDKGVRSEEVTHFKRKNFKFKIADYVKEE